MLLSVRWRRAIGGLLVIFALVALARYLTLQASWQQFLVVLLGVLIWTLPKGALLRFMGGRRPNRSALAANASSEIPGLGFPLSGLGVPWPALTASLGISTAVEGLALLAMGTAPVKKSFLMSLYMNMFSHVLVAGHYLWPGNHWAGASAIVLSFLIFILPIFVRVVPGASDAGGRQV